MSSTLHAVVLGPNFTGLGNLPVLIPSHHVDLQTGIKGGVGGLDFGFPRICGKRMKPVSGIVCILMLPCLIKTNNILARVFLVSPHLR